MNLILDDGYQFGLGAFETIPVYQGRPVWLEAHERRLRHTLEYLGIGLSSDWENHLWEYVYSMDKEDWVLKILASDKNINFTSRANPYASMADRPGYVIALSSIRRNETSPLVRHKTFNYGDSILAKRQARAEGIDEPIFCNMQGQLTEGAVSNLFFIKNGRLYTPPVEAGLLPGIIRSYLCQCYDVIEKPLYPEDIRTFDECFLTNSLMGLMPIRRFGTVAFPVSPETQTAALFRRYEADKRLPFPLSIRRAGERPGRPCPSR